MSAVSMEEAVMPSVCALSRSMSRKTCGPSICMSVLTSVISGSLRMAPAILRATG